MLSGFELAVYVHCTFVIFLLQACVLSVMMFNTNPGISAKAVYVYRLLCVVHVSVFVVSANGGLVFLTKHHSEKEKRKHVKKANMRQNFFFNVIYLARALFKILFIWQNTLKGNVK